MTYLFRTRVVRNFLFFKNVLFFLVSSSSQNAPQNRKGWRYLFEPVVLYLLGRGRGGTSHRKKFFIYLPIYKHKIILVEYNNKMKLSIAVFLFVLSSPMNTVALKVKKVLIGKRKYNKVESSKCILKSVDSVSQQQGVARKLIKSGK